MLRLIRERLVQLVLVLFLLSTFTFALMKLAPGDPVLALLKVDQVSATQAEEAALRSQLGFDLPVHEQYGQWLWGILQFDLGDSYMTDRPVLDMIIERIPITFQMAFGGIVVMIVIAFPLGLLAAMYPGRLPDHLSRLLALIGSSIPSFWMGLMLMYAFSYKLQWLPTMGTGSFKHTILPSITLGLALAAVYARLLRSGLLDSLSQEYIRAARARGIAEWRILTKHALRAALLPVVTVFGMSVGHLLAGTVVVEILFAWPGLGSMAVEAIFSRDYPVIQGYVLMTGVFVVIVNLLVDLSYGLLDPRIRYGKGEPS